MQRVNSNLVQMIRQSLYMLKREYGAPIDIYKLESSDTDVRTGVKTIEKSVTHVPRGIVLPCSIKRLAQQSISLISFNKEFVAGGSYDAGLRDFIIDRRDTASLPELTQDDWIVYDSEKYQIVTVQEFEANAGWIIAGRKLIGEVPEQIFSVRADNRLALQSVATAVVE